MAPFSKLLLSLALVGTSAEFVTKIKIDEESEPIELKWSEGEDSQALAQTFVETHASNMEGLGCSNGDIECFTNVVHTHMSKFEEIGDELPILVLSIPHGGVMEEMEEVIEEEIDNRIPQPIIEVLPSVEEENNIVEEEEEEELTGMLPEVNPEDIEKIEQERIEREKLEEEDLKNNIQKVDQSEN
eukprot:CAMPEP_0114393438 /NCGR_PEP_ID=MMETSP0102-20121206/11503_1 /TAXON_ID=38822 ORGANISM="Pteridomonas danica, Strain PT" /NCGR_SAMPLE_ID=MMETSP0102 /ASSEMBLY_ACC=CAM_ASM_000212 /LENGTH=185 /DNA_ID=CAMNT_0001553027 /DNA_START=22 /DNA_END=579 /DNA_ORIENTATION=+